MRVVLHNQHAPRLGQRDARQDRGRFALRPGAAVDEKSALVEAGDADARALSAAQPLRQDRGADLQPMPMRKGSSDGQCELRAGAEAGMRGQHANQPDTERLPLATAALQHVQVANRTIDFGGFGRPASTHLIRDSRTQLDLCFEPADHQPHAAEAATQRPARIEKAEMQARRCAQRQGRPQVGERGFRGTARVVHRA